jgi:serine-type D-Ala-D-Ala carboxypeptidase/endopeptidase (penicillin-binding protein 4)
MLLSGLLLILCSFEAFAAEIADNPIRPFIQNGGYAVKNTEGRIEGLNSDIPFVPASTIKLVTSLAALQILGPDYRFATSFHVDREGNLFIKGEGDPTLTSEDVAAIAKELFDHGLRRANAIILDGSAFALETTVDGSEHSTNPYDAEISPLAVNFNTLPLRVRKDGIIDSGEEQTPNLPMMQEIRKSLTPGRYRLNVGAFPVKGGIPNEDRYAGELFGALLRKQGIQTGKAIQLGAVPENAFLVLTHRSGPVRDIVRDCLEFSNNFIANQLFIACGRTRFGPPATWKKGRLTFSEFTHRQLHLVPGAITMVEGSGLSRKNQISPRTMITVLEAFAPFADLLPTKHEALIKSGTLKGVYCYSGYLEDQGRMAPFAIMLNQQVNSRNQILSLLAARFAPPAH